MEEESTIPTPIEQDLPSTPPSFASLWKERILYPTIFAGTTGAAVGALSKNSASLPLPKLAASYASNYAIVAACYCGAREYVRVCRRSEMDDLWNSAAAGFGTGAILGRIQGGRAGAYRYSLVFSFAGTAVDFAMIKLRPAIAGISEMKLPEWFPIQVLDEEAMAAKEAREKQIKEQMSRLGKKEA